MCALFFLLCFVWCAKYTEYLDNCCEYRWIVSLRWVRIINCMQITFEFAVAEIRLKILQEIMELIFVSLSKYAKRKTKHLYVVWKWKLDKITEKQKKGNSTILDTHTLEYVRECAGKKATEICLNANHRIKSERRKKRWNVCRIFI